MSNIDRAADTLKREGLFDAEAHCCAQALDYDGLLTPELPAPDYEAGGVLRLWYVGDRTVAASGGAVQISSNGNCQITFDGISDAQIAQLVQILCTSEGTRGV